MTTWTPTEIQELRHRFGLTQEQFAALFAKTRGAVAWWESGFRRPTKADRHAMDVLNRTLEVQRTR